MRPIVIMGWILLVAGALLLGAQSVDFLEDRQSRVELVSRGATTGDVIDDASLATTGSVVDPGPDNASRVAIVAVAIGILLVVVGSPGVAPSERRLIGT